MSKFITVGAVVLLAAMVANIFLKLPALYLALNVGFILFSSAVILYQIKEVVDGGEQLHLGHADPVCQFVQYLLQPAATADGLWRRPRLIPLADSSHQALNTPAPLCRGGRVFVVQSGVR